MRRGLRLMAAALGSGSAAGPAPAPASAPRIGTHDGTFHCDEVLACCLLRLLPRYRDAEVVRTRDPQRLAQCDVVVDVGGEYDPERHRYDHHQRSFMQSMRSLRPDKPWTTKLSSAGLVYCHFGSQILAELLGQPEDGTVVTVLYDKLYENFVQEIDAIDNGIAQAEGEPRYALTTTLSARVGHLNPRWNDPDQDTEAGFRRAMELVRGEFMDRLDYYHRAWLPARVLVEEAIRRRFEVATVPVLGGSESLGEGTGMRGGQVPSRKLPCMAQGAPCTPYTYTQHAPPSLPLGTATQPLLCPRSLACGCAPPYPWLCGPRSPLRVATHPLCALCILADAHIPRHGPAPHIPVPLPCTPTSPCVITHRPVLPP
uniref:MYG1 exonuclease n=1 Tax=Falco tinnunculus TaxID=100819 RepID=A0A8C4USZ6_FALTI